MLSNKARKVVPADEQAFEKACGQAVDEDASPVTEETPEFESGGVSESKHRVK